MLILKCKEYFKKVKLVRRQLYRIDYRETTFIVLLKVYVKKLKERNNVTFYYLLASFTYFDYEFNHHPFLEFTNQIVIRFVYFIFISVRLNS